MSRKILEIHRHHGLSESEIVSLIEEAIGEQFTENEFSSIGECISGEDYVISEFFFPSLKHLFDIVKSQKDDQVQTRLTLHLATMMRYAVWKMYDPNKVDPEVRTALQDCAHLFLDACYSIAAVDDKRYLLMGVAAAMGDAEAAKRLHDLGSGY
jgi:hypothetical protein